MRQQEQSSFEVSRTHKLVDNFVAPSRTMKFFLFALVACYFSVALAQYEDYDQLKKLRHELFEKRQYDKLSRPVKNWRTSTQVKVSLTITRLGQIEPRGPKFTVDGWMYIGWKDEHLSWTPINFGGLTELRVSSDEIWRPDLLVYNGVHVSKETTRHANTMAIVQSTGDIIWVPPVTLETTCKVDLRQYPRDTQVCNITIGSWTFHASMVNISAKVVTGRDIDDLLENIHTPPTFGEWAIVANKSYREDKIYECCKGQIYPSLTLQLSLKRQNSLNNYLVTLPQALSLLLVLLVFWFPARCLNSRLAVASVSILLSLFSIHAVKNDIGIAAGNSPYTVRCSATIMSLATLSFGLSVLINYISRKPSLVALPTKVSNSVNGSLGWLLCLSGADKSLDGDKTQKEPDNDSQLAAALLDRICFALYALVALATHL